MDLDELQSVRDRERQTDKLQQLRESFYTDAGAFIDQLRAERDRVAARNNDPYAPEATRLNDEIEAATQLVEDIYERRIGKLVKAASFDAAGLPAQADGMTAEEQALFDALVDDIEHHRERVLDLVADSRPDSSEDTPDDQQPTESASGRTRQADASVADAMGAPGPDTDDTADRSPDDGPAHPPDPARNSGANPPGADAGPATDPPAVDPRDGDGGRTGRGPPDDGTGHARQDEPTDRLGPAPAVENGDLGTDTRATDGTAREPPARQPDASTDTRTVGPDADTDGGSVAPGEHDSTPVGAADGGDRQDAGAGERPAAGTMGGSNGRQVRRERVLVTEDIDTFVGLDDRDYDLAADDVVTLPAHNADILVERGAARRLS